MWFFVRPRVAKSKPSGYNDIWTQTFIEVQEIGVQVTPSEFDTASSEEDFGAPEPTRRRYHHHHHQEKGSAPEVLLAPRKHYSHYLSNSQFSPSSTPTPTPTTSFRGERHHHHLPHDALAAAASAGFSFSMSSSSGFDNMVPDNNNGTTIVTEAEVNHHRPFSREDVTQQRGEKNNRQRAKVIETFELEDNNNNNNRNDIRSFPTTDSLEDLIDTGGGEKNGGRDKTEPSSRYMNQSSIETERRRKSSSRSDGGSVGENGIEETSFLDGRGDVATSSFAKSAPADGVIDGVNWILSGSDEDHKKLTDLAAVAAAAAAAASSNNVHRPSSCHTLAAHSDAGFQVNLAADAMIPVAQNPQRSKMSSPVGKINLWPAITSQKQQENQSRHHNAKSEKVIQSLSAISSQLLSTKFSPLVFRTQIIPAPPISFLAIEAKGNPRS